ncbi:helix-turn-helix domain-containing protein [Herminiimonas sp. NPDC097707]|uniref:helix-turn-helix domain-containing protein n=1 Tax=Herminiimonas sp. NPDC097707 TaxID=3364007 RepID=UPI003839DB99
MKSTRNDLVYVLDGLFVAHEAAMAAGASVDEDDDEEESEGRPTQMDGERYELFLSPLPQILGVSTETLGFDTVRIWKRLNKSLVLNISKHCPEILTEVSFYPDDTYRSLIDRVEKSRPQAAPFNLRNLSKVAQRAFSLIREHKRCASSLPDIVIGLALIGWVLKKIKDERQCAFCPAQIAPEIGGKYCHDHSQGNRNDSDRTASKQYMKYRVGQQARRLADQRGIQLRDNRRSILSEPSHMRALIKILIANESPLTTGDLDEIHHLLQQYPHALAKLGGASVLKMTYLELIECIRDRLNPYRFNESMLQFHIRSFEVWLSLEAEVLSVTRGSGKAMSKRLEEAIVLAQAGNSQADIAKNMGVTESTISNWKKKYETFRSALNG